MPSILFVSFHPVIDHYCIYPDKYQCGLCDKQDILKSVTDSLISVLPLSIPLASSLNQCSPICFASYEYYPFAVVYIHFHSEKFDDFNSFLMDFSRIILLFCSQFQTPENISGFKSVSIFCAPHAFFPCCIDCQGFGKEIGSNCCYPQIYCGLCFLEFHLVNWQQILFPENQSYCPH